MRTGSALTAVVLALALVGPALAQSAYVPRTGLAAGTAVCPGGLCQVEALEGLFEALAATEAGQRERPVHILQIGDSHTAGDRITGALRAALQVRFGNGGRGALPPGIPYDGYAPLQVQVEARDWTLTPEPLVTTGGYSRFGVGLAGIQGIRYGPDPALTVTAEPGGRPRVLGLCGRAGPGAGAIRVSMASGEGVADFAAPEAGPVCREIGLPTAAESIRLTPVGPGVPLYDLWLATGRPGVVVSNLGAVGATLRDLAARDEAVTATELAYWRPQLIVLAFGTNEGFDDALNRVTYEALLRGEIARMRRLAPAASLLLMGAPDAERTGPAGGCSADGLRRPPPSLAVVRDVQRRVAADMGVAFWDWHGRMGGDCSADRLALMAEPHMRGDRVHFTTIGADWIGGVFAADLTAAFDGWKITKGQGD
ncbi:GDSL-type esterase/lipase family protein [uncultured Brevundimonas sp.]|uniref:GDSL-type esterase/lipase family protein n=1 Tax=uncultured Brevundimonas sp. TaxID=213418 RepID=UPI0030EBB194|tara:strand:- start:5105 stop:6379 length:1275 start_codon:yes stop_codon:yes gene_type:complete